MRRGSCLPANWSPPLRRPSCRFFFEGQNSLLFHLVSRFSTALREALLLRELAKRIGADVTAHIGVPTSFEELADWSDRHALVEHLRDMVYSLDPDRDLVPVTPCPTD